MNKTFIERYKLDLGLCDGLINYFKNNTEYKHQGISQELVVVKSIKDSTDVHFYSHSHDKHIFSFFNALSGSVLSYMIKYNMYGYLTTETSNNIQHYKPGGGYPHLHYERGPGFELNRQLVYMLYLNTVTDKGGTHFPYQNITTPAVKGDLIIWPAEFTHPHQGIVSPTEEKYIVTGWLVMGNIPGKINDTAKE
jgi:hypothetical protein|tara:strand:+ start:40 stop:621 length:582 start_codon:yes stop_codon:yes gene_type:complete